MAKRKARGGGKKAKGSRKAAKARRSAKPKARARTARRKPAARKAARRKPAARKAAAPEASPRPAARGALPPGRPPRLDRPRRTLDETIPTPPSSLDMDRRGIGRADRPSRARAEPAGARIDDPAITGGDVDVNLEQAYFSGDEAPGGDNPTPDQDVVDDIGRAIGIEYQDNEELRGSDKVTDRDKHRWELDPASAEDYKERK